MTGPSLALTTLAETDAPLEPAVALPYGPLFAASSVPVLPLAALGGLVVAVVFYLALRRALGSTAYRMRLLSPERVAAHRHDGSEQPVEALAASITERANAICRAVAEDPSELRAEMCAMGYRRCADDMVTLTHRMDEEAAASPFARRLRMKSARKKAVEALVRARKCLPQEALRATRQEQ